MPNEGAYLGSVRSFDCLRGRCVIDSAEDGGCWHLRTAYGRPIPAGKTPKVWVFQRGSEPAIRAMWRYTHGDREIPPGVVVYRKCKTHDCVNPKHLAVGERGAYIRSIAKAGGYRSPAQLAGARKASAAQAKLTPQLRQWLLESPQNGCEAAHALGISQGRANTIRQQARKRLGTAAPSIFAMGAAMNSLAWRAAA